MTELPFDNMEDPFWNQPWESYPLTKALMDALEYSVLLVDKTKRVCTWYSRFWEWDNLFREKKQFQKEEKMPMVIWVDRGVERPEETENASVLRAMPPFSDADMKAWEKTRNMLYEMNNCYGLLDDEFDIMVDAIRDLWKQQNTTVRIETKAM